MPEKTFNQQGQTIARQTNVAGDHNVVTVIQYLVQGVRRLPMPYEERIQEFLEEYLGTPERPTPFGGRVAALAELDAWLDDAAAPPYLLLTAPAGRGKSALLARYVVNTDPTSIIEELLPVAVPVYRLEPEALDRERSLVLAEAEPSAQTRTAGEVQEALQDAFGIPGLEQLLEDAVETRRQALAAERRRMREQMETHKTSQPAEWLAGIDDLARGSFDLLTVTVLFPA
jgi:hypothetical protein